MNRFLFREAGAEAGRVDLQAVGEEKSAKTRRTIQGQYLESNCAMLMCKYDYLLFSLNKTWMSS